MGRGQSVSTLPRLNKVNWSRVLTASSLAAEPRRDHPWRVRQTIPARFAREMLADVGLGRDALLPILDRCDLSEAALSGRSRLVPRNYLALTRLVIAQAGDEMRGCFAKPVPLGSFAQLMRFLVHLPTLESVFTEGARFYALFNGAPPWSVEQHGNLIRLRLLPAKADPVQSALYPHFILLALWHVGSWMVKEVLPVQRVVLPAFLEEFASQSRFLFGRQPEFGPEGFLEIAAAELQRAPLRAPHEAGHFARKIPLLLISPGQAVDLESRVRGLLASSQPVASLSEQQAARQLGIARQTLVRRLAKLGTSYHRIREELRRDLACALLSRGTQSIAVIAEQLGYSEPSAFQRAFKQWTGVPPGEYRRERFQRQP